MGRRHSPLLDRVNGEPLLLDNLFAQTTAFELPPKMLIQVDTTTAALVGYCPEFDNCPSLTNT